MKDRQDAGKGDPAAGTNSGSPLRRLVRALFAAYAWVFVLLNALFTCGVAFAREPFIGKERAWCLAIRGWSRRNIVGGMFRLRVEGLEHVQAPAVIASVHQGSFDANVLAVALPMPFHFVARIEVLKVPLVGTALERGRHVLIQRGGGPANEDALRQAEERLREGSRVVFFPEGTRSADGRVQPFRSGAFRLAARAGCPLVPAVISGTRMAVPKNSLLITPCRIVVRFLEPRTVSEADAGSEAYREEVRAEVAARLEQLDRETGPRL